MKLTPERAKKNRDYCRRELKRDDLSPDRRLILEAKLAFANRVLQGRCRICLRPLDNPVSRALGIGPECQRFVAEREAAEDPYANEPEPAA